MTKKAMPPIMAVAVDLDDCIADQTHFESTYKIGKPFPGAREFLKELKGMGCTIIIHTARINSESGPEFTKPEEYDLERAAEVIRVYMAEHDLPYDSIWAGRGKPITNVYFDDKAVHCSPRHAGKAAFADALSVYKYRVATQAKPIDMRGHPTQCKPCGGTGDTPEPGSGSCIHCKGKGELNDK